MRKRGLYKEKARQDAHMVVEHDYKPDEKYFVCGKCEFFASKLTSPTISPLITGNDFGEPLRAYGDFQEKWIPPARLWEVEYCLIEQILLVRIWHRRAESFEHVPCQSDIIHNHLKDYKLAALNMNQTKVEFD